MDVLHWKTGGFLSLQIAFAQGHILTSLRTRLEMLCWILNKWMFSAQYRYSHLIASKAGAFYFYFSGSCFHLDGHWARVPVRLTKLLAEACSPFVLHVFLRGPGLSLRGMVLGRLPVGARCHAETQDLRPCNLPALAFLNAKQHGVGQCWLSVRPESLVKGPAHHHLTADQAGMLGASGTWLCVDLNKSSFELLNHPPVSARTGETWLKEVTPQSNSSTTRHHVDWTIGGWILIEWLAHGLPLFFFLWIVGVWVDMSERIGSSWFWCGVINELEPTDNLSRSIPLAVCQCTETMGNACGIPTYLLFIDINWDALLSFLDNCRPSVPSNKIFNRLMDMQRSGTQSRAHITTCLVLAKTAQRMTENPFDLRKGERSQD